MEHCVGQFFVFARPLRPDGVRGDEAKMQLLRVVRLPERRSFSLQFLLLGQPPLEPDLHRLIHRDFENLEMHLERVIVPRREQADPVGMYYEATLPE
jgi:hypothetical protein